MSDEIECSAISVFNLVDLVLNAMPDKMQYSLDLNVLFPFNFHKIVNVRCAYNKIINKCLTSIPLEAGVIENIFRLSLQALAMERNKSIIKILL